MNPSARWAVPGTTFGVWALAAACAVFWGLRLGSQSAAMTAQPAPEPAPVAADPAAVVRLLGGGAPVPVAGPQAPSLASRFALAGVVAGRSRSGVALISVDGRPAKPFRVGTQVTDDLVLLSVEGRRAALGPANGAASLVLDLPSRVTSVSAASPVAAAAPGMAPPPHPPSQRAMPQPAPMAEPR